MGETSPSTSAAQRRSNPAFVTLGAMLLIIPVGLALAVPLYQRVEPQIIGIPFYYWFQMLMAVVTAVATSIVFRMLFTDDPDGGDA